MKEINCACVCHIDENGKKKTNHDHMWCAYCEKEHRSDQRHSGKGNNLKMEDNPHNQTHHERD